MPHFVFFIFFLLLLMVTWGSPEELHLRKALFHFVSFSEYLFQESYRMHSCIYYCLLIFKVFAVTQKMTGSGIGFLSRCLSCQHLASTLVSSLLKSLAFSLRQLHHLSFNKRALFFWSPSLCFSHHIFLPHLKHKAWHTGHTGLCRGICSKP